MNGFFQVDGPFYKFGNMLGDIIILSLLWVVFSLPLITAGASTTALFYVSTKRVADKEGYLFQDFWKSFRLNFVQSTLVWIVILLIGRILVFNISHAELFGQFKIFLLPVQLGLFFELFLVSLFIFPLIARFEMSFVSLFKSAFFMANRHILVSLLCFLIAAVVFVLAYVTGIALLIAPGVFAFSSSCFIIKIFKKYRPEIDNDEL